MWCTDKGDATRALGYPPGIMADPPRIDPYAFCPDLCTHELGRGVLILELKEGDGPYPEAISLSFGALSVLATLRDREDIRLAGAQR